MYSRFRKSRCLKFPRLRWVGTLKDEVANGEQYRLCLHFLSNKDGGKMCICPVRLGILCVSYYGIFSSPVLVQCVTVKQRSVGSPSCFTVMLNRVECQIYSYLLMFSHTPITM